ncbi:hypothetical protein [Algoriphagus terrigena]|uniref:hypothetical protein n=1 Tax=Algoriphagus terrigena TaxID=344884 RepID=UPI0004254818|nr:hypothetical protein [Algoriphagus terrigena]
MQKRPLALVFGSVLLVGTLDILAACIQYYLKTGSGPALVFKFIASGVFGAEAFSAGDSMIVYGLLFHYSIAVSFTIFFFLITTLFPALLKAKVVTGIGYGIAVWIVMNLIVVPISNTPKGEFDWINAGIGMLILIVCIGLPLSFIAAKARR